jgi:hypothetical protein
MCGKTQEQGVIEVRIRRWTSLWHHGVSHSIRRIVDWDGIYLQRNRISARGGKATVESFFSPSEVSKKKSREP